MRRNDQLEIACNVFSADPTIINMENNAIGLKIGYLGENSDL